MFRGRTRFVCACGGRVLFVQWAYLRRKGEALARGFFFDNTRCTGCRTCMMACADYHDLGIGPRLSSRDRLRGRLVRRRCRRTASIAPRTPTMSHWRATTATRPECVHVCPTGAMHKNELGLVCVDAKKCIGCGYCTVACPYHAPSIDRFTQAELEMRRVLEPRRAEGKQPVCVEACPLRALVAGDVDELSRHVAPDAVMRYHARCPIRPTRGRIFSCVFRLRRTDADAGRGLSPIPPSWT